MMVDNLKPIEEYPDISFIEDYTIQKLEDDMISWFMEKRKELTGEDIALASADDRRIILQTGAYFIFQGYMYSDDAGKMGLLKYSRGNYLDNMGMLKRVYRHEASGATTTIRFSMNTARETTTGIPAGTRMTAGDGIYFATDEYGEILNGNTSIDIRATCTKKGVCGNDYAVGEIKTIVDPIPYIDSAANITKSANGADIEADDSLRERIYAAPSAYSAAGTSDAYEYFIRKFNSEITDISVSSPEPCIIKIRYLLKDGEIPEEESMKSLEKYLSDPAIKPLSDLIQVAAPETVDYELNLKYFINQSDKSRSEVIQQKVNAAISEYKIWQRTKMGRDLNPNELIGRIMLAGAKRVEIITPVYTVIPDTSVAVISSETVSYGGIEDD